MSENQIKLTPRELMNEGFGCDGCLCSRCLYYWSSRCFAGNCFDDYRAEVMPRIKQSGEQISKLWSNWNMPGEQDKWCRGGTFVYATYCEKFIEYAGQKVQRCIKANVQVYQDGYIKCALLNTYGCERCYKEWDKNET